MAKSKMIPPTVVYLHGFSSDKTGFLRVGSLGDKNIQPVYIDLPGFGAHRSLVPHSWDEYIAAVYAEIQQQGIARRSPIHLVGHSHGAMVAYGLASLYPDTFASVTFICPVARGGIAPYGLSLMMRACAKIIGMERVVQLMKIRVLVDSISLFSFTPSWPKGTMSYIIHNRRKEAEGYSPGMLKVLDLQVVFPRFFKDTKVQIPSQVIYAKGDRVVSHYDRSWYESRLVRSNQKTIPGGHLVTDAYPQNVAHYISRYVLSVSA